MKSVDEFERQDAPNPRYRPADEIARRLNVAYEEGYAAALARVAEAVRALQGWHAGTLPGIQDTVPRDAVLALLEPKP